MEKLTDEQVEQASKAMFTAWYSKTPLNMDWIDANKPMWIAAAHAAAPFLQFPWQAPTKEEIVPIYTKQYNYRSGDVTPGAVRGLLGTIGAFIQMRNAVLVSKPVDLRRERVRAILQDEYRSSEEGAIDRIIAALDEVAVRER